MISWKEATTDDALRAWDSGDSVWSCEMGGIGPGYEQCIQLMGFEMLRAMVADPPTSWDELKDKKWDEYRDRIEATPAVKDIIHRLQPSGAQFGAAMSLASVFAMNGYAVGMEKVPEDRRIQVSKSFP